MANVEGDTASSGSSGRLLSLRENSSMFTQQRRGFPVPECQTECYAAGYWRDIDKGVQLLAALQVRKEIM